MSWHRREASSLEERFGLLDKITSAKYKKKPVLVEPQVERVSRKLKAVGLTCGIGSMLVGARDLGFEVIGNFEWRDYYRYTTDMGENTFVENFPGAFIARGKDDVPSWMMPGGIDFAAGHPECGRYSSLSHTVKDGYQHEAGGDASDIPLFLKLVAHFRPRFFLMDDLPASFGPLPMSEYKRLLPDYDLFPEWVSNWGYGNIQKYRNRMFMVGSLKSERFTFVPGEAEHSLSLVDFIGDIQDTPFGEEGGLANHQTVDLDATTPRYVNMRWYGDRPTWREIQQTNRPIKAQIPYHTPEGEEKVRPGTWSPEWDGPCPVLSGGFTPIHPLRKLPMSLRERARVQGFDDAFVFYHDEDGPFAKIWEPYSSAGQRGVKQTGKAMPLQFCTYFAKQVKAHIEGVPFKASNRRVAKPHDKVSEAKMEYCMTLGGYSNQDKACKACWLRDTCPMYKEAAA